MPNKLPIDLPDATPGTKFVHGVNVDDLTDGPQGTSQKVALIPVTRDILISQFSTATSQEPSSINTPIRIEFGPAFGTALDPVEMDVTGLFTVNEAGSYFIKTIVHFGRTTSTGEVELFFRLLINGTQLGNSAFARLDDDDTVIPSSSESFIPFAIGDTFEFELIRDSSNGGINNGGLFQGDPATVGWANAQTALIAISRLTGNAANLQADGDVVGGGASQLNEVATYSSLTGLAIKSTADVSIEAGVIDRITPDEDLWIRVDSTQENIFIGRHVDTTGAPNVNNTTLFVTANSTNEMVLSTLGNNSQAINFVKSGVFRGKLSNNRDRNSIAIENANGKRLEILPNDTATFLVDKIGIGATASANDAALSFLAGLGVLRVPNNTEAQLAAYTYAQGGNISWNSTENQLQVESGGVRTQFSNPQKGFCSATNNGLSTPISGIGAYNIIDLGPTFNIQKDKNFAISTNQVEFTGTAFAGTIRFVFEIWSPPATTGTKDYDIRFHLNNFASGPFPTIHQLAPGEYRQISITVSVSSLTVGALFGLRLRQVSGAINTTPIFPMATIEIIED